MSHVSACLNCEGRSKVARPTSVKSKTITAAIAGWYIVLLGCGNDPPAENVSPNPAPQPTAATAENSASAAATTGENSAAAAATTSSGGAPVESGSARAPSTEDVLRSVIRQMYEQAATGLSPAEIETETDARLREGVAVIRDFYPEFLDDSSPNHAAPAEDRIGAYRQSGVRMRFQGTFDAVPITQFLLHQHGAKALDAAQTGLLAQLIQAEFLLAGTPAGEGGNRQLAEFEKMLFPGSDSRKFVTLTAEETRYKTALTKITSSVQGFRKAVETYPRADRRSNDEPAGLSWRVHILPFIDQQALHGEFQLNEPWDSPHNRQLIEKMPDAFQSPGVTQPGMTSIHVFVGEETPLGGSASRQATEMRDGMTHTLACVAAGPETATEWTRPGGIEFDPEAGMSKLGTLSLNAGVPVAFMEGEAMFFPPDMPADLFARFVMHDDGGEVHRNLAWSRARPEADAIWPFGTRDEPGPRRQMKRIGAAMIAHHEAHQRFPSASADPAGQSGLSWRVHLLPFLDHQELHDQFKLVEPWDSPHNHRLLDRMPDVFRAQGVAATHTVYHVYVGKDTPFGQEQGVQIRDVTDGMSNTIMIVMGVASTAAEWTKPGALSFDPAEPFRGLATVHGAHPILTMDGLPHLLSPETPAEAMFHAITHREGQPAIWKGKLWW